MSVIISSCGQYRYRLERKLGPGKTCLFIMLNPSTADAEIDDNTIRRCIGFTKAFGFGHLLVGNLFAFRATKPADLRNASEIPMAPTISCILKTCAMRPTFISLHGVRMDNTADKMSTSCVSLNTGGFPSIFLSSRKMGIPATRFILIKLSSRKDGSDDSTSLSIEISNEGY